MFLCKINHWPVVQVHSFHPGQGYCWWERYNLLIVRFAIFSPTTLYCTVIFSIITNKCLVWCRVVHLDVEEILVGGFGCQSWIFMA